MRRGTRWRGLSGRRGLPALALTLCLSLTIALGGCGLAAHEVNEREVVALEHWLEQRPEVDEVSTERGRTFRAGLPGEDEWARTRVVLGPGTTSDQLLALGQELRERGEPRTITGVAEVHVDGVSLLLGGPPEADTRAVELLVLLREAFDGIQVLPAPPPMSDEQPPPVMISDDITVWVDRDDLSAAAEGLAAVEPPAGEGVLVRLVGVSPATPEDVTTHLVELGDAGESQDGQPGLSAVSALQDAGLRSTLTIESSEAPVVSVVVTSREQWDLTVDTMGSVAPDTVLRAVLGPETVPGIDSALAVELPVAAIGVEDAHRLPDLLGTPPSPWQVTGMALSDDDEVTATLDGRTADLAALEELDAVPTWPLSEVLDAYRFTWVDDGTLDDDSTLVLPSTPGADFSFLDLYRAADRAGQASPDVEVVFDGIFRLSWSEGVVGPDELRPVLEELRGDWGPQRLHVTQGDSDTGRAALLIDTTGTGVAQDVSTPTVIPAQERRDSLEELGWVVELWDETAGR